MTFVYVFLKISIMRKITLMLALIVVFFSGCKKDESPVPNELPGSLNELKAQESFNWSTGMPVVLSITGLPTQVPVKSTLSVSLPDGSVLFSSLHQMDKDLSLNLIVPTTVVNLVLKYGNQTYNVSITNGKATFSFIPVITEE